jgi:hypothetical protein
MTKWKSVKFGDVVRQVKDKVDPKESGLERFVAGEHMDTDNLHIRRWGELDNSCRRVWLFTCRKTPY